MNTTHKERKNLTVAFYARVSTEHEAQVNAFDNQLQWCEELLAQHPEWRKYKTYSDKGITGTSIEKRPGFTQMLEDAKAHRFDLVVTREVSRFARNTVDTLAATHELRKLGIEVYFVNDAIWSFDSEGDLRLAIMAAVAQEESHKISTRVSAGQAVSRTNGVYYGNGNVLGYNRIETKEANKPKTVSYPINPEQARTVRKIFDMYLEGHGLRAIQYELERLGHKTATGKSNWHMSNISRVLSNPFYTGIIVYRKQWTPDFLEQKKINNIGDMPFEYAQGTHEPLVTKEEFMAVQERLGARHTDNESLERDEYGKILPNGEKRQRFFGKKDPVDVWSKLLVCECGAHFNRKIWHRDGEGKAQYAYQCYSQKATGTAKSRENHGLSTEGICSSPMVPEWKLQLMADRLFSDFFHDRKKMYGMLKVLASEIADARKRREKAENDKDSDIAQIDSQIEKLQKRLNNFQIMRADGELSKAEFDSHKKEIDGSLQKLRKERQELLPSVDDSEDAAQRATVLAEKLLAHPSRDEFGRIKLMQEAIGLFVSKIVVHDDYFEWYLRYSPEPEKPTKCTIKGGKRRGQVSPYYACLENDDLIPSLVHASTGSYQGRQVIARKFAEFTVTGDDARAYLYSFGPRRRVLRWSDIRVSLYI